MRKQTIGMNRYLYTAKLSESDKINKAKEIEINKYHATITERFVNNELAFEAYRPTIIKW